MNDTTRVYYFISARIVLIASFVHDQLFTEYPAGTDVDEVTAGTQTRRRDQLNFVEPKIIEQWEAKDKWQITK